MNPHRHRPPSPSRFLCIQGGPLYLAFSASHHQSRHLKIGGQFSSFFEKLETVDPLSLRAYDKCLKGCVAESNTRSAVMDPQLIFQRRTGTFPRYTAPVAQSGYPSDYSICVRLLGTPTQILFRTCSGACILGFTSPFDSLDRYEAVPDSMRSIWRGRTLVT